MGSGYLQRKLAAAKYAIVWEPQPGPQTSLLACPKFEVFFGGARGGGKTDGMLGEWASHQDRFGEHSNGIMFRRERTQLVDTIERSRQIFSPIGASYHEQDKLWRFPNGSRLQFAYLDRDADADGYQGRSHTRVYIEEIGTFPSSSPIFKLMATLRSGHGIPCGFRATGNPGGPGHQWVKARYIDPAPLGWREITDDYVNPWTKDVVRRERIFIPSKLGDNKYLGADYVANLQMVGNPQLVRAWLEGDWSVIEGAFFPEFSEAKHVIRPFEIPATWLRFRSADWGSARPFSIGWWAVVADDFVVGHADGRRVLPRGAMVRYREWYGSSGPNVGLKLTAEEVADGIVSRETKEPQDVEGRSAIAYGVLDPAAFASDGGPCIAERMARRGVFFRRADNARVARLGALGGWDQLRSRLVGHDDRPMIYFFSTGRDSIRTLPALQHDRNKAEDVDTESEDHAPDECFVAGTMVDTDCGSIPIEKVIWTRHRIWSGGAWRRHFDARLTKSNADAIRLRFSNGRQVTCTKDHLFMDHSGEWRYARDLLNVEVSWDRSLSVIPSSGLMEKIITAADFIFNGRVSAFIARFGSKIMARFQRVATCTIRMKTDRTMTPAIWNVLRFRSIWGRYMAKQAEYQLSGLCQSLGLLQQNGMVVNPANDGIGNITTGIFESAWLKGLLQSVSTAGLNIWSMRRKRSTESSVAITVEPVRCVSVEDWGKAAVYCLTEPATEAFTIEGGLIVHNCRYACMSRPYIKDVPNKESGRILSIGSLNQVRLDDLWEKADNQRRTRI